MVKKTERFELFNRCVELQSQMKSLGTELDGIKKKMKDAIGGDDGFLQCLDDGSGFKKEARTTLVPNMERLEKNLSKQQLGAVTSKQFDWERAKKAIYEGKLTERDLDVCMDRKVSVALVVKFGKGE